MKRLLCILSNMNAGGAETFLMKIYRQIDKSKFQMDFCINVKERCFYEDEIESMGGIVYRIPTKSEGVTKFKNELTKVVQEGNYDRVLRITSNAAGFLDLKIAKKAGASICAARSSNSSDGKNWKVRLVHRVSQMLYGKYVDVKIAPSDLAARYTFGNIDDVVILHNAIDLSVFRFSKTGREKVRKEYGYKNEDIIIGHIGRFMTQKNHIFLIDIFKQISEINCNYKLLLIGKGELENQLREKVHQLGLDERVVFGGVRSDIPDILSAMDVFVFPSLYEGMPNTVIEAQATGLPCIIADTITREADITGLVDYLPLNSDLRTWVDSIVSKQNILRESKSELFIEHKYDIQSATNQFEKIIFGE